MEFGNGQQDIIIYQTSIARQIRLVDNSINDPKLSSTLQHFKTVKSLWQILKNNQINIFKKTFKPR